MYHLGGEVLLHPGQFLLGSTLEYVRFPGHLAGLLVGRSSWARLGLIVETAGLVQPGWVGTLTFELANVGDSPIRLCPGLRIAQLVVMRVGDTAEEESPAPADGMDNPPYAPKYIGAVGPKPSRLGADDAELTKMRKLGETLAGSGAG